MVNQKEKDETGVKQNPKIERSINAYLGNTVLLFLALLSIVVLVAAAITAFDTVVRDFPKLWQPMDEYSALQGIIENILLVAIAAELSLLLLFHKPGLFSDHLSTPRIPGDPSQCC